MNISFKRDMTHNYMVPEQADNICEEDYRVHMLMENHIRGLLPCSIKRVNCQSRFFYDITSRQPMERIYGSGYMKASDIRQLLRGLHTALKEVKKYLLDADCIVLEPQTIYMDIETKEPLFCYLPGYQKDILQSFCELTAYLLEHLDQSDSAAVLLGYEIYRKARVENYSLKKLLKDAGRPDNIEGTADTGYADARTNYDTAQAGYSASDFSANFDNPSRSKVYMADEPAARKSGKNSSPSPQAKDPYSAPPSKAPKKVKEKKPKAANPAKHQKSSKKSVSHYLFSGLCFGFAILLIVAAAWFWGLDTTQIGGIVLLLTGLLAYGLSLEGKKKTKEKKDQGTETLLEGFQEEPLYDTPPFEQPQRQPRQMQAAYPGQTSRQTQTAHPVQTVRLAQATQPTQTGRPAQTTRTTQTGRPAQATRTTQTDFPAQPARPPQTARPAYDFVSEQPAYSAQRTLYDTQPFYQSPSFSGSRLGDTGVLYEEDGGYSPQLVLVSMDPRQNESILLEKDCYIVGKLSSQSDIVLEHPSVSRVHAKIDRIGNDYYLCDLNSTNGTFLNGKRLSINESVKLQPSDEIFFARVGYYLRKC